MSKEIGFRVWDNEKKRYCKVPTCIDEYGNIFILEPADKLGHLKLGRCVDGIVEPDTGLLDRNGKEIYEGDILEYKHYSRHEVFWEETHACFAIGYKTASFEPDEPRLLSQGEIDLLGLEVVGNVNENKDLLEELCHTG